jgi:hypothetical protein
VCRLLTVGRGQVQYAWTVLSGYFYPQSQDLPRRDWRGLSLSPSAKTRIKKFQAEAAAMKDNSVTSRLSPAPKPAATPSNEAQYEQQHDRAYKRVNNQSNNPHTEMDV